MNETDESCDACLRAAITPRTGQFTSGCLSCQARMLAYGPIVFGCGLNPGALEVAMHNLWPEAERHAKGRLLLGQWVNVLFGRPPQQFAVASARGPEVPDERAEAGRPPVTSG